MNVKFIHEKTEIDFELVLRKRKTMQITVLPPRTIKVFAPINLPKSLIIKEVKNNANWILKKLALFSDDKYKKINRRFINNEEVMYLGQNYLLKITIDNTIKKAKVKLSEERLCITVPKNDKVLIKKAIEIWYREKSREYIEERIKYYEKFFTKEPLLIKVKEQKKIWGSCTHQNKLLFNWRCVMARSDVFDYIIVHEMCHMCHKNHSRNYWNMVKNIMPNYREKEEWLKDNGFKMYL